VGDACTFCRIVGGELGASFVLEEEEVVGFLDVRPLRLGHARRIRGAMLP
jgi:diadenosine tetraphosphate (Ap4A) HIT family hydrolase